MRFIRSFALAALLIALLALTGCAFRARVLPDSAARDGMAGSSSSAAEGQEPEDRSAEGDGPSAPSADGEANPDAPAQDDRAARRRAYSDSAPAVLSEDAARAVQAFSPDEALPVRPAPGEGESGTAREDDLGGMTVTETLPSDDAQELGVADDAPSAETALQYYETLLASRTGSLFECKRLYVYWETTADHVTAGRDADAHAVILLAGGYNVAVKRPADALAIDDGWISRKAPDCVVKCVPSGVLGQGVLGGGAAKSICAALLARPGWRGLPAVRAGRVLLLSEELMATRAGRTAAAVALAQVMYPDLMADVDAEAAARQLLEESVGADVGGQYFYIEKGE